MSNLQQNLKQNIISLLTSVLYANYLIVTTNSVSNTTMFILINQKSMCEIIFLVRLLTQKILSSPPLEKVNLPVAQPQAKLKKKIISLTTSRIISIVQITTARDYKSRTHYKLIQKLLPQNPRTKSDAPQWREETIMQHAIIPKSRSSNTLL